MTSEDAAPAGHATLAAGLAAVVAEAVGGRVIDVQGLRRLSGGASRETWSFDAVRDDGSVLALILRRDPPGGPKAGMALEREVLTAAARAGVPVPTLLASTDDPAALGAPFIIMERIAGETIPRRILRDDEYAAARPRLAAQCGEILAAIHSIPRGDVPQLTTRDEIEELRATLDSLGQPHPAFELGLRWLSANRPVGHGTTVVHGDFRNGNLIVGPEGVRSVLDWELAHVGDPMEDLGWLCVRAWRFGIDDRRVGGFGDVEDLVAAYEKHSGRRVDASALTWWEVLGTLKWGVYCILQAWTHVAGFVRSVELAAIGRRVCENEWDLLQLLPAPWNGAAASRTVGSAPDEPGASPSELAGGPHDMPSAPELVTAVREFIQRDVMGATDGRVQFHARVAANVLGMVARELQLGPSQAQRHAAGLAALGFADDNELGAAIRAGSVDDRLAAVAEFVRASVADKVAVANPDYVRTKAEARPTPGG